MRFLVAPKVWSPESDNPFSPDGSYQPGWSCFSLKGGPGDGHFTGRTPAGCWFAKFGIGTPDLAQRLIDFILYENRHDRTVILDFPEEIDPQDYITRAKSAALGPNEWRPSDPKYAVHSTTLASWHRIRADGMLKAANLTDSRPVQVPGQASSEVHEYLKEEPPEYKEYIMFGSMGPTSEMILASYAAGKFQLDENSAYQPGARLYFDNRRIVAEGRCTRDGLHTTKVLGTLPLQRYLLLAVTTADLRNQGQEAEWTPKRFSEEADGLFLIHMEGK